MYLLRTRLIILHTNHLNLKYKNNFYEYFNKNFNYITIIIIDDIIVTDYIFRGNYYNDLCVLCYHKGIYI